MFGYGNNNSRIPDRQVDITEIKFKVECEAVDIRETKVLLMENVKVIRTVHNGVQRRYMLDYNSSIV